MKGMGNNGGTERVLPLDRIGERDDAVASIQEAWSEFWKQKVKSTGSTCKRPES